MKQEFNRKEQRQDSQAQAYCKNCNKGVIAPHCCNPRKLTKVTFKHYCVWV